MIQMVPLTAADDRPWAHLLARCFDRAPADMQHLLAWLRRWQSLVAWGAWDDDQLVAQYSCLLRGVHADGQCLPAAVSINMAVDPAYRGRGLVKQMAAPVYEAVQAQGGQMGLGFSNDEGVRVDRHSQGYGYTVLGQLVPALALTTFRHRCARLTLTDIFPPPEDFVPLDTANGRVTLSKTPHDLQCRYAYHPFRSYQYGVWQEGATILGVVVYRETYLAGVPGVSLLDVYSVDEAQLIARWLAALHCDGKHFVHLLTSPQAALRAILPGVSVRFTRRPYYLTVKALAAPLPLAVLDYQQWDITGGDIL